MIYLDHAATTKVADEVIEAMTPYWKESYGNASALYSFGNRSKRALLEAKENIAKALGVSETEIYITSGGTESNNWALKGIARERREIGKHIITSKIEHHSILHVTQELEAEGFEVSYVETNEKGELDLEQLKNSIRRDTILISIMFANNEIGTLQDVKAIGEIAHQHGILFHTDAVQAFGHEKIQVKEWHIDLLSASAHKFYGPKGVGFLYIRKGLKIRSLLQGGAQEGGKRAGTENIPAIVGMGVAASLAMKELEFSQMRLSTLRDYGLNILEKVEGCVIHGHRKMRLSNHISVSFPGVLGEELVIMLDLKGICISSGAACSMGTGDSSHVLQAMGFSREEAYGAIRITLGRETTKEELDKALSEVVEAVGKLRMMNPAYRGERK